MGACREVSNWMTGTIIVPVMSVVTAAKEVCESIDEWVEEQIEQPVESWVTQQVEKCKDLPWYDPRGWFCWLVDIAVKVITWVLVTVGKWVAKLVCTIVTQVVGFIIEMVVRIVSWLVTFLVCIFTEPGVALASFRDLWHIVTDAVDRVFEAADAVLGFVQEALGDLREFVDSLASSFGWLGVVFGLISGLIGLAENLVSSARDILNGAKELVGGLLSLSPCRMLRGVVNLGAGIGRLAGATGLIVAAPVRVIGAMAGGVRERYEAEKLERMIREKIDTSSFTDERKAKAFADLRLGRPTMGAPFRLDARRLFLNSENPRFNPRILHQSGVIDLYRLAGYLADCADGMESPAGEVVYAGTRLRVTYADLAAYLADGPGSTTPFEVYGFSAALARSHVEIVKRKARAIGIRPQYDLGKVEATTANHVPFNAFESGPIGGSFQQALLGDAFGRAGTTSDDLRTVPNIAVFRYAKAADGGELLGLCSWYRPPTDRRRSGVSWRARTPDIGFRWVLAHECGHYWGLDHSARGGGQRPARDLMFKPSTGKLDVLGDGLEYLVLGGEPRFPYDDALTAWEWLMGDEVAASVFPA